MAYSVSVQFNGGFLPNIILLTLLCYSHRGTRLNAMKRFVFADYAVRSLLNVWTSMYICMVITYSRVWINRVRLPILLVVS